MNIEIGSQWKHPLAGRIKVEGIEDDIIKYWFICEEKIDRTDEDAEEDDEEVEYYPKEYYHESGSPLLFGYLKPCKKQIMILPEGK